MNLELEPLIDPCVGCDRMKFGYDPESMACHFCYKEISVIKHQARLSERKALVKWLRNKAGKYSFDSFDHENATGNVNRGIIKALNKLADELEQSIGGKHDRPRD